MEINWRQSIGKQIVVKISGYEEEEKVYNQTIITTIRSINIDDIRYNIITDLFFLSGENIIDFFRLIQIPKHKKDAMAIISYIYIEGKEKVASQVEGKILGLK